MDRRMMSPELMAYLLSWAVFYTGYPIPDELPTIDFVPHSFFVETVCNYADTPKKPCKARAMYNDNIDGVIFMDEEFIDNIGGYAKSIIVHELVHYLQDMSGYWKDMPNWQREMRCQERLYREREAYMAQDKYAYDVHSSRLLLPRTYTPCGEY